MGLYLVVFASDDLDDDLDGVDVGSYDDWHHFRQCIADHLEGGVWGARFPTLMNHPDVNVPWSPDLGVTLLAELAAIRVGLEAEPASGFAATWQVNLARQLGLTPRNLAECFIDVDGEPLLARLVDLVSISVERDRPIEFL
jgi:hypothetical protein